MGSVIVLIVDDEECIRNLLKERLTREGREVLLAARGEQAVEIFRRERPDITILDLDMPEMNGLEVLGRIRAIDRRARVMVFSGSANQAAIAAAKELGVTEFLEKGHSLSLAWDGRKRQV